MRGRTTRGFPSASHLFPQRSRFPSRVKDEESGQELTEETFISGYDGKPIQSALKLKIKRDGKPYLDAELTDVKLEEELDDSVFARP